MPSTKRRVRELSILLWRGIHWWRKQWQAHWPYAVIRWQAEQLDEMEHRVKYWRGRCDAIH
jgi:hypothetical protein